MVPKGIRDEFLEELWEASLCLHETCPIAGYNGGRGGRGEI